MSGKLLGSLQTRLNRVFGSKFSTAWLDKLHRVHVEFESNLFLSDSEIDILKSNVREILHYNHCLNMKYSVTCLPYYLRKIEEGILYQDYVILGQLPKSYIDYSGMEIKDSELKRKLYRNWIENLILVDDVDYEYIKNA